MSDQNVELVIAAYEWINRKGTVPAHAWHLDGEYVNSRDDPDHATYRGHEAIEQLFASWVEAYPDLQLEPVETRANGDRVFVWIRYTGHGAGSGAPLEMELAHIVTVEDGKVRRLEEYMDRAEGLAVAGLAEQP